VRSCYALVFVVHLSHVNKKHLWKQWSNLILIKLYYGIHNVNLFMISWLIDISVVNYSESHLNRTSLGPIFVFRMNSVQFIQVKLTNKFPNLGLNFKFCLYRILFNSGFTLHRFYCIYIYIYVCACDCRTNIIVLHALTTGCYMTS